MNFTSPGAAQAFCRRPAADEHHSYFEGYVRAAGEGDIRSILRRQRGDLRALLQPVTDSASLGRYAPGKWSLREVVGHMSDAERVFGFRLIHFARGGGGELPSMDQDEWVREARFDERSWEGLREESWALRTANLAALDEFDPRWLEREGQASGSRITVRALLWILAGHEKHHLEILKDRYLG